MRDLTPLERLTAIPAALRTRMAAEYWITSVEELVATARASNQEHGDGKTALAIALGVAAPDLAAMIDAAFTQLPPGASFDTPVDLEFGSGLILDGYSEDKAAAFPVPFNLPAAVEPLFMLPPPRNQGQRNSCVAFALAAGFQMLSKDPTLLSEQFLYWAAKAADGVRGDVGTNPITAARQLQALGICTDATWPYAPAPSDHNNPGHGPPPPPAQVEAALRRLGSFKQLPATNSDAHRTALAAGQPVLIGLHIREHWTGSWQGANLGRLRAALPGERRREGHAMLLVGYRSDASAPGGGYFIVRNSWGAGWAKENSDGPGLCHVPYQLIDAHGLAAIALEQVVVAPAPAPPQAIPQPRKRGRTRATLGGGASELAALHDEAQDLHQRMSNLVERLAQLGEAEALVAPAEAEASAAPVTPAMPAAPAAGAGATTALSDVGRGPLILLYGEEQGTPAVQELYPNGLSLEGVPLLAIDAAGAVKMALGKSVKHRDGNDTRVLSEPNEIHSILTYKDALRKQATGEVVFLGTIAGVDSTKIEEARWAVVINASEDAALLKAIWPLIEHRSRQMGLTPPVGDFRDGESAGAWYDRHTNNGQLTLKREHWGQAPPVLIYRPGAQGDTSATRWLERHGAGQAPVDPARGVPFFLLLLGRPGPLHAGDTTGISFSFQYELDIFWGVGRLCFSDDAGQHRLSDYTTYAERLVGIEQRAAAAAAARLRKAIAYFGTRHALDHATMLSADKLIRPLTDWSSNPHSLPQRSGFGHQIFLAEEATRSNFERLLSGSDDARPPAVLFAACHGLGLPLGHAQLVAQQGSLVMGDWSGRGNVQREHYVTGDDLARLSNTSLEGSFAFIFACYGAGCPAYDEFIFDRNRGRPPIAPFPLIARLPQQLLLSGMLGVLGHVERAWTYSFHAEGARSQTQGFEDVLGRLIEGRPAGDATDQFNMIQGQRAMALTQELEAAMFGKTTFDLAALWMARNDARNYALLGDPAARLPYSPK